VPAPQSLPTVDRRDWPSPPPATLTTGTFFFTVVLLVECLGGRPTPCQKQGLRRGTTASLQQDGGQPHRTGIVRPRTGPSVMSDDCQTKLAALTLRACSPKWAGPGRAHNGHTERRRDKCSRARRANGTSGRWFPGILVGTRPLRLYGSTVGLQPTREVHLRTTSSSTAVLVFENMCRLRVSPRHVIRRAER
jgi:hypothetical protein